MIAAASPIGSSSSLHHARQHVCHIRCDFDFVQFDVVGLGDLARVEEVVGHGLQLLVFLAERDRIAFNLMALAGRDRGDQTGIEPAAEKSRYRHVGDHMRCYGLFDHRSKVRDVDVLVGIVHELVPWVVVAFLPIGAVG